MAAVASKMAVADAAAAAALAISITEEKMAVADAALAISITEEKERNQSRMFARNIAVLPEALTTEAEAAIAAAVDAEAREAGAVESATAPYTTATPSAAAIKSPSLSSIQSNVAQLTTNDNESNFTNGTIPTHPLYTITICS